MSAPAPIIFTRTFAVVAAALMASLTLSEQARAHPARYASAKISVWRDGRFRVTATFDFLAFLLNDTPDVIEDEAMNALLDEPPDEMARQIEDARERFVHGFSLRGANGQIIGRAETVVRFPTVQDMTRQRDVTAGARLPMMQEVVLEGTLPDGIDHLAFRFPEALGTLVLTIERPGEEPYSEPVEAGSASSLLPVQLSVERPSRPQRTGDESSLKHAGAFVALGFTHILPHGLDHVLFVLGLFLLNARLKPLLWQVTAFTVAHSITLALAMYGIVRLPSSLIEPLIALSIAFIAVENLFTTNLKPWRPAVVFGFGLVHGLGFASVLSDTGLARAQFATALVCFNIGVELGQLTVIALALATVGWWRQRWWYRHLIAIPTSGAIALIAVFWTIQRVWNGS